MKSYIATRHPRFTELPFAIDLTSHDANVRMCVPQEPLNSRSTATSWAYRADCFISTNLDEIVLIAGLRQVGVSRAVITPVRFGGLGSRPAAASTIHAADTPSFHLAVDRLLTGMALLTLWRTAIGSPAQSCVSLPAQQNLSISSVRIPDIARLCRAPRSHSPARSLSRLLLFPD